MNDGALRMRFLASLGMTMFALGERRGMVGCPVRDKMLVEK